MTSFFNFAKASIFLAIMCLYISPVKAQQTLQGTVVDASTNEPLAAATVQIQGTYRGTITNNIGEFELSIPQFPVQLHVRYIGYNSITIDLQEFPSSELILRLQPTPVNLREVVVTGEDPAIEIMREVIRRKRIWRDALDTYTAEAYTRQRLENDTGIVTITESLSQAYWDKRRGTREIIKYRNQTSNIDATQNFASATGVPNFYDDDISISGFDLVGVTHPNALSFYHFKLEGFRQIDDKTVFDISVTPRRRLQPTFQGMIAVQDEDFALIEVDLRPGESVMFPPPIQEFGLWYRQQFSNFGGDFWLPVDIRIDGTIKIGFPGLQFPPINFFQLSRLTNYEVNIPLPDSLYQIGRRLVVDTLSIKSDQSYLSRSGMRIPLDDRESSAYSELDSTQTLEKAFKPSGAFSRFVDMGDDEERNSGPVSQFLGKNFKGVSPLIGYNRVDGGRFGVKYTPPIPGKVKASVSGTYLVGVRDWDYGVGLEYNQTRRINNRRTSSLKIEANYDYQTLHTFRNSMFDPIMTASKMLLAGNDYFNYYKSEAVQLRTSYSHRKSNTRYAVSTGSNRIQSLNKITNYSIPGGYLQRENPLVDEGIDEFIGLQMSWGSEVVPFGITGTRHVEVSIIHGNEFLSGDFNYTKYRAQIDWRFETFYKRRFMPNTLDMRMIVGTSTGTLPHHTWHASDTRLGFFTPFGAFKTLGDLPIEAEHVAALFWEHNFRTIPFEALGMQGLAKKGVGIIVTGAHGYFESDSNRLMSRSINPSLVNGYRHEIGLSVNSIFSILRVDTAMRLDSRSFYAGISLARIF
jgi:hypothetical protein